MARLFNGTSDQIACSGTATTAVTNVTISAWIQFTSLSNLNAYTVIHNGTSASLHGYGLRIDNLDVEADVPGVGNQTFNLALADTGWHFIGIRVDGTTNWTGNLDTSTQTINAGATANTPSGAPIIGNVTGVASQFFPGSIADVAIWTVRLTDSEMSAMAKGARPGNIRPLNLVFWMPIGGIQSPEPELSGAANNGTLTGTTQSASGPPIMLFSPRWPQKLGSDPAAPSTILLPGQFTTSFAQRVSAVGY